MSRIYSFELLEGMPLYELFCLARPTLFKNEVASLIRRTALSVMHSDGIVTEILYYGTVPLAKAVRSGNNHFTDVLPLF